MLCAAAAAVSSVGVIEELGLFKLLNPPLKLLAPLKFPITIEPTLIRAASI